MATVHTMRKKRGDNGRPAKDNGVGRRHSPAGTREILAGETFEHVLADEMRLRGHNNEDAAREIPTSPANVSRWLRGIQIPTYGSAQSAQNIANLVRYLRLRGLPDYGALYINSQVKRHEH